MRVILDWYHTSSFVGKSLIRVHQSGIHGENGPVWPSRGRPVTTARGQSAEPTLFQLALKWHYNI
jgi:hypothetical protein